MPHSIRLKLAFCKSLTIAVLLAFGEAGIAYDANAQQPRVRELSSVDAVASQTFGLILNLRALSDGKVLVNDATNRQVFLLDSKLANPVVVIGNEVQSYGTRPTPIIPYLGDSTLFVDPESRSLLLIDAVGKMVRTLAPPRPADLPWLSNAASGVDAKGNLIYRGRYSTRAATANGSIPPPTVADSAPIVRANFETRTIDTISVFKLQPSIMMAEAKDSSGKVFYRTVSNPWLEVDDWTVLSNGTVVVVRGNDYHVDLYDSVKGVTSAPRLPFAFRSLSESDKQQLVDSAKAADAKRGPYGTLAGRPVFQEYIAPSSIPDYYPSIRPGAAKADFESNLWVLPNTSNESRAGELVYDVVDSKGVFKHRVRLPVGKSIAGFGPNGTVFLMSRVGTSWTLERARVAN